MRISDWSSDVCSSDLKIGTYLKALAAQANGVPFYVALPSPTIDWTLRDGVKEIPIEERSGEEVAQMTGRTASGTIETVTITPDGRSEEHTSELQSLMRISYAVFCLKKQTYKSKIIHRQPTKA